MVRSGEVSLYFYHTRPDGSAYYTASKKINGENIAMGMDTPEEVVEGWMNSAGHRANILQQSFQSIGVGCFWNGNNCYWVQCFGSKEAEGTELVQTSGTEEIKQEISVSKDNLELHGGVSKASVSSEFMFIGEIGYLRYAWSNQTGFAYSTGFQEDFQFTSDKPDVISIDEDGKFVVLSEGTATLRVALKADPTIEFTTQIETKQQDLSDENYAYVSNVYQSYTYTGSAITPKAKVWHRAYNLESGKTESVLLEEGIDYTITFENNVNAGTGRIVIEGIGKYKGTKVCEFAIEKAIAKNVVSTSYEGVYDGEPHGISLSGVEEGSTIQYSTDNVTWVDTPITRTEAGKTVVYYQITNPNYKTVTGSKQIVIRQKNISECTCSEIADVVYNGNAITPEVIVKNGEKILQKDIDYILEYKNNTNAGEAHIRVIGRNQYTGEKIITFSIIRDISTLEYASITAKNYTGYAIEPYITIKDGDKTLIWQRDYSIAYSNNIEAGKATAIVTGEGYYSGTKVLEFDIKKKISSLTIISGKEDQVYTGEQICPKVTICDNLYELQEGKDYTVTYGENTSVGIGRIYIKGTGYYEGEYVVTFSITPKTSGKETSMPQNSKNPVTTKKPVETTQPSGDVTFSPEPTKAAGETTKVTVPKVAKIKKLKAKVKKTSIVLQWNKVAKINGYQIQISTNSKYKNPSKITVGKTKTKYTFKKKKAGKKYYIRIRAYQKYTAKDGTTKKAVGKWVSIKVKK